MNPSTSSPSTADWGVLLLRVSLGILFLAHSIVLKLITYGANGTAKFFVGVGLPGWLAYATIVWELVGGILLVLGIQTRL
ncbi:MAG: DoxX family protein, partial [Hyphomicrobiales bacterium]|nr:DoxX family protein [Hyphomicrobiales bacterium]